jgi:hypothetical protein
MKGNKIHPTFLWQKPTYALRHLLKISTARDQPMELAKSNPRETKNNFFRIKFIGNPSVME